MKTKYLILGAKVIDDCGNRIAAKNLQWAPVRCGKTLFDDYDEANRVRIDFNRALRDNILYRVCEVK